MGQKVSEDEREAVTWLSSDVSYKFYYKRFALNYFPFFERF